MLDHGSILHRNAPEAENGPKSDSRQDGLIELPGRI